MPRDGSQEYHAPFPDVVEGTTIESTVYNGFVNDIVIDLNTPRPVKYGGTGADNPADAMQNLGGELAKQLVTNYDVHPFQAGSFYSAAGASGAPTGNAFTGICYVAVIAGVATTDMFLEARDQTTGLLYVRQKKANVWGGWTVPAGFSPGATPPVSAAANSLWWDTTRGKLFFYYQDPSGPPAQWVEAVAVPDIDPNTFVEIAGDSMTGFLTLNANAVNPLHAVPKQQLDARFTGLYAAPLDALAYSGMQINGSMEVSQEKGFGVPVTVANSANYVVDGFGLAVLGTTGTISAAQGALTGQVPGFSKYMYFSCGVVPTLAGATDGVWIYHWIEGYRWSRLGFGTAGAQPVTIGFWILPPLTGSMAVSLHNGTRVYVTDVSVTASVWQYKTVTIPGDTVGTWAAENTGAARLAFCFGAGSTRKVAANTWLAAADFNALATSSTTSFFTTVATNVMFFTGVVVLPGIEAPSAARSPLIMRPYDQELLTCQRYFRWLPFNLYFSAGTAGYVAGHTVYFPTMRAGPTIAPPTADPNTTQTAVNTSSNTFGAITLTSAMASGVATAAGLYQVTGFRAAADARL